MVITECIKQYFSVGREPNIYFWRDSNHNEVDLLIENGDGLQAIEIKSSATLNTKFFKVLHHFHTFSNTPTEKLSVIYGGDIDFITESGTFKSWKNIRFLE
jgi:predicted AAA+ superfamily ATPase